jgi:golgi phosphoprotein 3
MEIFLTIPEEILLLSINESEGTIPNDRKFEVVFAASILMNLALNNRLDTDLEKLILVSNKPLSENVLDEALKMIFAKQEKQDPAFWISQLAIMSREFMEYSVASLISKKVLKIENQKLLWVFSKRKYPLIEDKELKEVKSRVRELVFGNDIPELRDIIIISLLHYGKLETLAFSEIEQNQYKSRIEAIAKMDLIGQAISKSLTSFVSSPFMSVTKHFVAKTPEEKLAILVSEMKEKFRISNDKDLPSWLREGTEQYQNTLDFIRETGTSDIYYHNLKGKYFVRKYSTNEHVFGSGK